MVMPRFRSARNPIMSKKNIVDTSGIAAAVTNTIAQTTIDAVDNPVIANVAEVQTGSTVSSIFYSVYVISEGGEVANEVPLVDFYFIKVPGGIWATFTGANLPTPGATGSHLNKRHILHTEKGLAGGGDASLAGVPMVWKGVIKIPRGRMRMGENDKMLVCLRCNFASKFCIQAIYKYYQ